MLYLEEKNTKKTYLSSKKSIVYTFFDEAGQSWVDVIWIRKHRAFIHRRFDKRDVVLLSEEYIAEGHPLYKGMITLVNAAKRCIKVINLPGSRKV